MRVAENAVVGPGDVRRVPCTGAGHVTASAVGIFRVMGLCEGRRAVTVEAFGAEESDLLGG